MLPAGLDRPEDLMETSQSGAARSGKSKGIWIWPLAALSLYSLASLRLMELAWRTGLRSKTVTPMGDPAMYVWSMGWVAHAIATLQSPWFSSTLLHPIGYNLLASPTSPGIDLVMAPITWIIGPVGSLNVALTLTPIASSLAMYACLRRWVSWQPAAIVCGGLWGFSPFAVYGIGTAWLNLSFLVVPPLLILVGHELLIRQKRPAWQSGLQLAGLLVAQFFISTEVLLLCCLALIIGGAFIVISALITDRAALRVHARTAAPGVVLAGLVSGALLIGPAMFALNGPGHLPSPVWPSWNFIESNQPGFGDYLSPATIHQFAFFMTLSAHLPNGALFGAGLLLVIFAGAVWLRRMHVVQFLVILGITFAWLARGYRSSITIWPNLAHLPVISSAFPGRFILVAWLCAAFLLALIADQIHRRLLSADALPSPRRLAGVCAGIVLILAVVQPALADFESAPFPVASAGATPWISSHANAISHHNLLTFPFPPAEPMPMVEQAQRGFGYNLIGAWGPSNHRYTGDQATAIQTLGALERAPLYYFYRPKESEMRAIRRSLSAWKINDVLVTNPPGAPNREVGASSSQTIVAYTQLLGMPEYSEGSWHWKVPKDLPPYLSLTKAHYLTCAITTPAIDPLAVPRCVMKLGTPTAGR